MAKINLLPPDLGPSASVLKFLNLAKKIAVVFGLTFFIIGTLLVGYIVFLRIQIQASDKRAEGLKNTISNLKSTEQSLYLLKERTGKIKELLAEKTQEQALTGSSSILLNHPGITLTEVVTSPEQISISAISQNASSLNGFFESVLSDNNYKNIKLISFSYDPELGYVFNIDLNLK